MEKEKKSKKEAYGVLFDAVANFVGRTIGNAFLTLLRSFFRALILCSPFKEVWNSAGLISSNFEFVKITYATAFCVIFIFGVVFSRQVVLRDQIEKENE